ncbi:MAG: 5'-methylthioadenosine/adenosylhomocysteine nucleosidase [Bacillota bacterium]|nr:5'-methylthioadenosine/adenosylhomocysteine nucleosidase [Bacillota bacterium]
MTRIGIIGAMDEEIHLLIKKLHKNKTKRIGIFNFFICDIEDMEIIIAKSGIGKVNSALVTQLMISNFSPDYMINTGIAGGISKDVNVLDIIIASETMQYDVDVRNFGYKLGEIPQMEKYIFDTDKKLLEYAKQSVNGSDEFKVGRIISGDKFISEKSTKLFLEREFSALCADMESGSIGQVCYINKVPYIAIRCISDNADESSSINYEEFKIEAAKKSADLIMKMINKI